MQVCNSIKTLHSSRKSSQAIWSTFWWRLNCSDRKFNLVWEWLELKWEVMLDLGIELSGSWWMWVSTSYMDLWMESWESRVNSFTVLQELKKINIYLVVPSKCICMCCHHSCQICSTLIGLFNQTSWCLKTWVCDLCVSKVKFGDFVHRCSGLWVRISCQWVVEGFCCEC